MNKSFPFLILVSIYHKHWRGALKLETVFNWLCLNPTAQKDNRGVLGTSFWAEEFSEILGYSNMADYSFS